MRIVFTLVAAGLLWQISCAVWSIARPERRVWPPRDRDGWLRRINSVVGNASPVGMLAVTLLGWNSLAMDFGARIPLAFVLIGAGAYLARGGVAALGLRRTQGHVGGLEQSGPYRHSRNPQYVGTVLLFLGLCLFAQSGPGLAITALGSVWLLLLPFAEEPWLRQQLGAPYERYAAEVPRFLPAPLLAAVVLATFAWVTLKEGPTPAATLTNRIAFGFVLAATAWLAWRRSLEVREPAGFVAAAAPVLFFLSATVLFSLHVGAVVTRPLRSGVFVYDFRCYALMLLGIVALVPALRGLVGRGSPVVAAGCLLSINLPLIPLQDFALAFSVAGVATLAIVSDRLPAARRSAPASGGAPPPGRAWDPGSPPPGAPPDRGAGGP